jgi:predicted nuclease of predicted toxin-antitoxin system
VFVNARHQCWTVPKAGLSNANDDDIAIYAFNKNAALVSHDRDFAHRRRENSFGLHVYLKCPEYDAQDVIHARLDEMVALLDRRQNMIIRVTSTAVTTMPPIRRRSP